MACLDYSKGRPLIVKNDKIERIISEIVKIITYNFFDP